MSNSASVRLSDDGKMSIYNLAGSVHFTLDITGYYASFPGISFFNNADAATCTSADSQPRFVSVNSLTGAMRVRVFDVNEAPMDGGFYCSVYNLGSGHSPEDVHLRPGQIHGRIATNEASGCRSRGGHGVLARARRLW